MAYSWLSGDDVVSNIFVDEESFDDSDSESGDGVYGYLGAFAMSRDELVEESHILTGIDEFKVDELSSEDALSSNKELLDTCSESDSEQTKQFVMEDDSRYKGDGSGSIVPDLGRPTELMQPWSQWYGWSGKWSHVEITVLTHFSARKSIVIDWNYIF